VKSKEMKTGSNLAKFSKEGYGSKRAVLPMTVMAMMIMIITFLFSPFFITQQIHITNAYLQYSNNHILV
jgi:hypothetical protein